MPICGYLETCYPERGTLRPGCRLAVDIGSARIGIARSDRDGVLASPLATVRRGTGDLAEIARLAAEHEVIEIIVGLPTGLSGRDGVAARQAREFAAELASLVRPALVRVVDERFTTVIAHEALRAGGRDSRKRRSVVDQAAAALLLQSALDAERSSGGPAGELVCSVGDGGS